MLLRCTKKGDRCHMLLRNFRDHQNWQEVLIAFYWKYFQWKNFFTRSNNNNNIDLAKTFNRGVLWWFQGDPFVSSNSKQSVKMETKINWIVTNHNSSQEKLEDFLVNALNTRERLYYSRAAKPRWPYLRHDQVFFSNSSKFSPIVELGRPHFCIHLIEKWMKNSCKSIKFSRLPNFSPNSLTIISGKSNSRGPNHFSQWNPFRALNFRELLYSPRTNEPAFPNIDSSKIKILKKS